MAQKNLLVFLVIVFALAIAANSVSAFGTITSVEVDGTEALGATLDFAEFAGERAEISVQFEADADASGNPIELARDAKIVVWVSGERVDAVESSQFDVLAGRTYTRKVFIDMPFDLDENLEETRKLEIVVESDQEGTADEKEIALTVQRESYVVEVLAVDMQPDVKPGESLVLDVVLKNRGRQFAEDTFLRISIPELGLTTQTYFGDLSPTDQGGNTADKEDAVERRTYLRIPSDTAVGLYDVVIEAFNDDAFTRLEKRVLIEGANEDTLIVTPSNSKQFSTGDSATYKLTLVNRGSLVRVYNVVVDAPTGLNVENSDPFVVVPAGSSRTVELTASSAIRDEYTFTAVVHSDGGDIVADETFMASVQEGNGSTGSAITGSGSTAVLLTVILAIVFIVLLVVLIVLLTRKPDKAEEFGESYY